MQYKPFHNLPGFATQIPRKLAQRFRASARKESDLRQNSPRMRSACSAVSARGWFSPPLRVRRVSTSEQWANHIAEVVRSPNAAAILPVSFKSPTGIRHDVEAETLYEPGRRTMHATSEIAFEPKAVPATGAELSFAIAGSGTAVLAIQGAGHIGRGWKPQVDGLSHQFRFVTFDNRGIGGSARGEEELTIARMAADALAVADAAGLDRFHVLGHSMGGLIALHLALTNPERVKSLALLCTFADGRGATRLSGRMLMLALRSRIGTRAMRRMGMIRMIMPDAYVRQNDAATLARTLGDLFGRDLADQPSIIPQQLRAMSRYSALSRLHELSGMPTLVASAGQDPIAPPPLSKDIASRIDGVRYVEFPDASHALPIQLAHEVNALLSEHLVWAEKGDSDRLAEARGR